MTKAEIILSAARPRSYWTEEELVVASWKLSNDAFGLDGFAAQFPDYNKVKSVLMGKKGLVAQKKIRKKREGGRTYYFLLGEK